MEIKAGYEPVARILQEALNQSQHGKGDERHAQGKPFLEQRMMAISRDCGTGGLVYQVCKKTQEAKDLPTLGMKKRELLGAIIYLCGLVLLEEELDEGRLSADGGRANVNSKGQLYHEHESDLANILRRPVYANVGREELNLALQKYRVGLSRYPVSHMREHVEALINVMREPLCSLTMEGLTSTVHWEAISKELG